MNPSQLGITQAAVSTGSTAQLSPVQPNNNQNINGTTQPVPVGYQELVEIPYADVQALIRTAKNFPHLLEGSKVHAAVNGTGVNAGMYQSNAQGSNMGVPIDIKKKIVDTFGKDAPTALAIAQAESGMNPQALGDTSTPFSSAGLFQIRMLPGRPQKDQLMNPDFNIKYAKQMFDQQGWKPWSTYLTGAYKKYINK